MEAKKIIIHAKFVFLFEKMLMVNIFLIDFVDCFPSRCCGLRLWDFRKSRTASTTEGRVRNLERSNMT